MVGNERVHERGNERINERSNERSNERIHERINDIITASQGMELCVEKDCYRIVMTCQQKEHKNYIRKATMQSR